MVEHNKIFKCERLGDVVVVVPQGDLLSYRYQDVHLETNAVLRLLDQGEVSHLIVDLSAVPLLGSVMIGSLLRFARRVTERNGKAAFCAASPQMLEVLEAMNLRNVWPYCDTRQEALQAVKS
ncbi:MAG: STAS domain-containing protein [Planctomycetes bacterium]|nr:STAS domain-containing protein [Planctomycetota bacterium]